MSSNRGLRLDLGLERNKYLGLSIEHAPGWVWEQNSDILVYFELQILIPGVMHNLSLEFDTRGLVVSGKT